MVGFCAEIRLTLKKRGNRGIRGVGGGGWGGVEQELIEGSDLDDRGCDRGRRFRLHRSLHPLMRFGTSAKCYKSRARLGRSA